ncbi:MAG: hypothetical protein QN140_06345 [Armatimonadota bacterium]|nr:hypothetical protein [Armatimonadota bacterium]MDR7439327.1 hypothetical protein [Armatimonadota bacterium]MDR7562017.1 hypothetical protein [Armatimonadota bacterium]MDR7567009.1 hypothetical protein [Armatimonadota bacterium]
MWLGRALLLLLGVGLGGAAGSLWADTQVGAWAAALVGPEPKALWYASRSTGWVSYALLWSATCLGLMLSGRVARGGVAASLAQLHRFAAGLALVFVTVHALILLGDRYLKADLLSTLLPFRFPYRPIWVGLGQLAAYAAAAVYGSVFLRRWTGYRFWRALHYAAFGAYGLVTLHLLGAGTDVGPVAGAMVMASAAAVYGLLCLRVWEGSVRAAARGVRSA